jgi:predicted transcriptional regulator
MGSVAQYTMRNADCPVIIVRDPHAVSAKKQAGGKRNRYVTSVMHQIRPIQTFANLNDVTAELGRARETGAPVTDVAGKCIGILTQTDIEKYQELKTRFAAGDRSVVDEMFEVDEYGMFRTSNHDFDQVQRHMTSPAITISDRETCDAAKRMFQDNPGIHHLVVVNDCDQPVGILEWSDVENTPDSAGGSGEGDPSKSESSP